MLHIDSADAALLQGPPLWVIGWVFSTITAVTFLAIAVQLLAGVWTDRSRHRNPLAIGTGLIFLTCGGGHLIHSLQLLYPVLFLSEIGTAARIHYMDWHLWLVDGLTAAAGVFYWMQRKRFSGLVAATALYEDLRERRSLALDINDNLVQDLNAARMALESGDEALARELLHRAKEAA